MIRNLFFEVFKLLANFGLQNQYFKNYKNLMDINYLFVVIYFRGLMIYSFWRKHFLIILLSLEFITLSIYFSLIIYLNYNIINIFFSLIFLSIAVCEGVLGLSIIVILIRSVGNEFFLRFRSLW